MAAPSSQGVYAYTHEDTIARLHAAGWWLAPAWGVLGDWPEPGRSACTCDRGRACDQAGKHPLAKWKGRPRPSLDALFDLLDWHRRLSHGRPFNVGVRNKASGLCTLDVDTHAGGPDGAASWAALVAKYGPPPATVADTRGHLYFRPPAGDWGKATYQLAPGVELFGGTADADHLTYCPPSWHRAGAAYEFLPGCAPWEVEPAPLPDWAEGLRRSLEEPPPPPPSAEELRHRSYRRARRAAGVGRTPPDRARAWLARRDPAVRGRDGHYHQLRTAWTLVKGFGLSEAEALSLLVEWDRASSPPRKEADLRAMVAGAAAKGGPVGWMLDRDRPAHVPVRAAGDGAAANPSPIGCPCGRPRCSCPDPGAKADPLPDLSNGYAESAAAAIAECRADREAREDAIRETDAAERVAELRRAAYPCERARSVLLERTDWSGKRTLNVVDPRCQSWGCPACAALHKGEWQANYRSRLAGDRPAWVAAVPAGRYRAVTVRIRRDAGEYFHLAHPTDPGLKIVVSSVAFAEGQETTRADAAEHLCRSIEAYAGTRKPGGSSRGWCLPKPLPSMCKYRRVGVVDGGLPDAAAQDVARSHGVDLVGIAVPTAWRYRARRWRVVDLPAAWDENRRASLYADLLACGGPRVRTSVRPTLSKDMTDRVGRTLAPAGCPAGPPGPTWDDFPD